MDDLYSKLTEYSKSDAYPFHMPGHKRIGFGENSKENYRDSIDSLFSIDITEISDFDNLYEADGILKEAQDRVASLYGSKRTYFLVNGSTVGILTAISAVAKGNDTIIVARNCHKSVFNAAYINKLNLGFLYPDFDNEYGINGKIDPSGIKKLINELISENRKIAAIVVTSPSYDGISLDLAAISKVVHEYDIPLIVDQAHGAHFGFHKSFPESAVKYADIVIHSVHKTLPAPTQTALLHLNGHLVSEDKITKFFKIYQTSSPSYVFMAGIDRCYRYISDNRDELFDNLLFIRSIIDEGVKDLKNISVCPYTEPGKLVITSNKSGLWLFKKLRDEYHLEFEMAASSYVLGILTVMDRPDGARRLVLALRQIDKEIDGSLEIDISDVAKIRPTTIIPYYIAQDEQFEYVELNKAIGRIFGDFINLYPPGNPIALPGELVTSEIIDIISEYNDRGYIVQGIQNNLVKVLVNGENGLSDGEKLIRKGYDL